MREFTNIKTVWIGSRRISCLLGNTHKMCYTHVIAS
jgi:hypothetical protein